MNPQFTENIGSAYRALENRLDADREEVQNRLDGSWSHKKERYESLLDCHIFLKSTHFIDPRTDLASRIPIILGEGYLAKMPPLKIQCSGKRLVELKCFFAKISIAR